MLFHVEHKKPVEDKTIFETISELFESYGFIDPDDNGEEGWNGNTFRGFVEKRPNGLIKFSFHTDKTRDGVLQIDNLSDVKDYLMTFEHFDSEFKPVKGSDKPVFDQLLEDLDTWFNDPGIITRPEN